MSKELDDMRNELDDWKPSTRPGSAREDRLICTAQTAVVAVMATILYAAYKETEEVCVTKARRLYREAVRQTTGDREDPTFAL